MQLKIPIQPEIKKQILMGDNDLILDVLIEIQK